MNNKGMGLFGLLVTVIIMAVLAGVLLRQYMERTKRLLPSAEQSARPGSGDVSGAADGPAKCEGRLVGNICVPVRAHSGQDDFDKMYK